VITSGSSFVDESMITGEPMPIEKNIGTVVAGTINAVGHYLKLHCLTRQYYKMVETRRVGLFKP
jgi:high-affinity K+ transport system ATPase subunit B